MSTLLRDSSVPALLGLAAAFTLLACSDAVEPPPSPMGPDASIADAGSDASNAKQTSPRREQDFVAVRFLYGADGCCGATIAVEAPRVLVLEDDSGEARFELTEQDYERVLDLVLGEEFGAVVEGGGCPLFFNYNSVEVVWADAAARLIPAGECLHDPDHPIGQLNIVFQELLQGYLTCPPGPYPAWSDRSGDPPPVRYLCYRFHSR